jgi:hypothetical protein
MTRPKITAPSANPFDVVADPSLEARQIQQIADLTVKQLDQRYPDPAPILRGVHPKSHGCVQAIFSVHRDLPREYQVGLFLKPGRAYRAWTRFSNASVRVAPDTDADGKHGSRGMAVKVLDAGNETLLSDRGRIAQDFLMINQPSFAFANVSDYVKVNQVIADNDDDPSMFFAPLIYFKQNGTPPPGVTMEEIQRIAASFAEVQKLQAAPVANPLEVQYFSAAPFLFGRDRVMKFSARPKGPLKPQIVPKDPPPDYLRSALKDTIAKGKAIEFDFMLQVRGAGEADLGIENATTVWDEAKFPFVSVATITIPAPQEVLDSPRGIEPCEDTVFTPWHSLPEHQPVGSINRLRKQVYIASADHRGANPEHPRAAAARARKAKFVQFVEQMKARKEQQPQRGKQTVKG